MFDGMMPPPAPGKAVLVSGVQVIPNVPSLAKPSDGAQVGICNGTWPRSIPRVLTIGFPVGGIGPNAAFPPAHGEAIFDCGILDATGAVFQDGPALACVLEYGSGAASQKVYFDWCEGSYNIPPCEFVRVSALPWGTAGGGWPLGQFAAIASVAEGSLQTAHVPTATGRSTMAAGVQQFFNAPVNARAMDVTWVGSDSSETAPLITLSDGVAAKLDYSAGSFQPGYSPLPVLPGQLFSVKSSTDATIEIRYYISL